MEKRDECLESYLHECIKRPTPIDPDLEEQQKREEKSQNVLRQGIEPPQNCSLSMPKCLQQAGNNTKMRSWCLGKHRVDLFRCRLFPGLPIPENGSPANSTWRHAPGKRQADAPSTLLPSSVADLSKEQGDFAENEANKNRHGNTRKPVTVCNYKLLLCLTGSTIGERAKCLGTDPSLWSCEH